MPEDADLSPVSELLSGTLRLFSERFKTFLSLMGLRFLFQMTILMAASAGAVFILSSSGVDTSQLADLAAKLKSPEGLKSLPTIPDSLILPALLGTLTLATIGVCVECWLYGALYYAAGDEDPGVKPSLSMGLSAFLPFGWLLSLVALFILLGTCLLIIPGILFAVWYLFAPFIFFSENKRGMEALRSSKNLASGYTLPILVRLLALLVILTGIYLLLWGIPRLAGLNAPLVFQIFSFFSIPFGILFQSLLYQDLKRIKSELPPQPG